jgi:pimeloyl-ACP methyl ester carboxylesterase
VLVGAPSDVVVFSQAFANHLRIPHRAHQVMRRNLEDRLRMRWEELHIPTIARGLRAPALLIHDLEDPDVPYSHCEEIAAAWPGAQLRATSGLGHRAILRDPAVVRWTIEFLAEDEVQ